MTPGGKILWQIVIPRPLLLPLLPLVSPVQASCFVLLRYLKGRSHDFVEDSRISRNRGTLFPILNEAIALAAKAF